MQLLEAGVEPKDLNQCFNALKERPEDVHVLFKLIKGGVGPSLLASSLDFVSVGIKGTDLRTCFEALIKGPENIEEVKQAVECLKIGVKVTELRSALSCLNIGIQMSELMLALSCISFGIKEE